MTRSEEPGLKTMNTTAPPKHWKLLPLVMAAGFIAMECAVQLSAGDKQRTSSVQNADHREQGTAQSKPEPKSSANRAVRLLNHPSQQTTSPKPKPLASRNAGSSTGTDSSSHPLQLTSAEVPAEIVGDAYPIPEEWAAIDLSKQTAEEAAAKSWGCVQCHTGSRDPHFKDTVQLGCIDCHGGDPTTTDQNAAHVAPCFPSAWSGSANPQRTYTLLNRESPAFIRFINPGDLRIAHLSCGTTNCHGGETLQVKKSMMTHGCMLWGAALYNNGAVPFKRPRYGESYSMCGTPQRLQTVPPPTEYEMEFKGVLPYLDPLPRFQVSQPGNVLRIFERGGRFINDTGIPEKLEDPGRPRTRLSLRGLGTANRTDPVFIGLQKTRLLDPTLNFLGTNDQPGDFRSSGCSACHIVYANDRSRIHSGPYAKYGNLGHAAETPDDLVTIVDPMIPKGESGHPVEHRFRTGIPTSQCITCHVHPGTSVMNSYLGYTWWDEETDAELMYPAQEAKPTAEEFMQAQAVNPDEAAARGNWSNPTFLASTRDLNPSLRKTQFADFHGHGWVYRAVFKKNREGQLLDHYGNVIPNPDTATLQAGIALPEQNRELHRVTGDDDATWLARIWAYEQELQKNRENVPVHLLDIHLEKGMHCVDCHFIQDAHGNGKLYGEVRAAIEIGCVDCHGSAEQQSNLRTSGPAAEDRPEGKPQGRDLRALRTPFGKRRFEVRNGRLYQNSMVEPDLAWPVTQVVDTIDPARPEYNALAALAKTVRFKEGTNEYEWGSLPTGKQKCAHSIDNMSCIACHSSWNPSCYGCHLPQKANKKTPDLHNEGDTTRNYVSYNFQTLRDEVYMLGRDGTVTGNKIGPARSSCAIHVGSYNQNRESIYVQQQTISGEGLSGISFSTNVPHTVRGRGETKMCSDCHLSQDNDNNALMAQLLMQGTNYMNFIGRYCWVATGNRGLEAVEVSERDEPQTVIGSSMHSVVYPERYARHIERKGELPVAYKHMGKDVSDLKKVEVLSLQLRGEYLYAACGPGGLRVFDVAFVDDKGFSQRVISAPVSPAGQRFYVRTQYAAAVAAPTTIAPDPTRSHDPVNKEPAVASLYAYLYVADLYEGLILVNAGTLLDGIPTNNFLERACTFNPDGILCGAKGLTIVGNYAYVCCDAGLVVVCLDDPLNPYVTSVLGPDFIQGARAVQVQFRYGFICDEQGIKVIDTTNLAEPKPVTGLMLDDARNIYVARSRAYVAGGHRGLVILDVKNPEQPFIEQIYDADGCINDLNDVKLGIAYVSQFAYLADGCNGLRVVQLTSPETPGNDGFNARPEPRLIAMRRPPANGRVLAVSEGVDRDRAVDESGNQIAVFGRIGAGPLSAADQRRMYLRPDQQVWKVRDIQRNWQIGDWRREEDLVQQLEQFYGAPQSYQRKRRQAPTGANAQRATIQRH